MQPRHAPAIDVGELIDRSALSPLHVWTAGLSFLVLFVDGLEFNTVNTAAPALLRAFHLQKSEMGAVFGWGYFGILIGSLLFGYIGDRYGRRVGLIAGVLSYSIPTLASAFATSREELIVLRLLAGTGIGGVIPNTVALLNELAPARYRASFIMAALVGYSTGNAVIARAAARLIPEYGWQSVFLVAGAAGILLSLILLPLLPESIRFLVLKRRDSPRLRTLLQRLTPDHPIPADAMLVLDREESAEGSWRELFSPPHRLTTALLWLGYFAESLTYLTLLSWLPVLLETLGLTPASASLTFAYASFGSVTAILIVAKPLDRFGPLVIVVLTLVGAAAILRLGAAGLSAGSVTAVAILVVGCCGAAHNSLHGIVGQFYPTRIRGQGVGWAAAVGRLAGMTGPVLAGYLLSSEFGPQTILGCIAAPYLVVAAVCGLLSAASQTTRARWRFRWRPVVDPSVPGRS